MGRPKKEPDPGEEQPKETDVEKYFSKKYGQGAFYKASSLLRPQYDPELYLSSGSLALNYILSGNHKYGMRRGRIMEIFGPEGTGKTTLAIHFAVEAQRRGIKVAYFDVEHALDIHYIKKIGIDIDALWLCQPQNGEECFEMSYDALNCGFQFLVFDSVPMMVSKSELEGEVGDAQMAANARMMGKGLKKLVTGVSKKDAWAVFVNQLRDKIGVFYGEKETTPGGRALRFYTSYRLDLRMPRGGKVEEGAQKPTMENFDEFEKKKKKKDAVVEVGNHIVVKTVKNKLFPPFRKTSVKINYGEGIDRDIDVLNYLIDKKIVMVSTKGVVFGEEILCKKKDFKVELLPKEVLKGLKKP